MQNIYWKEKLYFTLSLITTIGIYLGMIKAYIPHYILIYIIFIYIYIFFSNFIFIGHLQGNAIKISKNQFPEIYSVLLTQCKKLDIKKIPTMYLIQSGGILNAFATRFIGLNYVVIYSDIMEKAFSDGEDVVEFIIAHELSHIKHNHILKKLLILPANIIFLITLAYSRACEITCDNIGFSLSPNGAKRGLVLLSAGKNLFTQVNIEEFINNAKEEDSLVKPISELISTHPHITNRILNIMDKDKEEVYK